MALYCGNKKVSLYLGDKRVKLSIGPSGGLPDGYTQLSYIESSGPQYINTQINGTDVTRFRIKAYATAAGTSNTQVLGGTEQGATSFFGIRIVGTVGNWYPLDSEGKSLVAQTAVALIDATIVKGVSQTGTITNVTTNTEFQFAKFSSTPTSWAFPNEPLLLFGGASNRRVPVGRCYGLELYTAEGLVRNLIPVRRNSDNTVGMYDTVSGTFFTNAGTGEFIPGYKLPEGYVSLPYITSSGSQRIDTDVTGPARWVLTALSGKTTSGTQVVIAGTTSANAGTWYGVAGTNWACGSLASSTIPQSTKATADLIFDSTGVHGTVNGEYIERNIATNLAQWTIFHTKSSDSFTGNVYQAIAYQNDVKVAHLVPAQRTSDGALGLYDLVNNKFFTNAGSGNFTSPITTSAASLMSLEALSMDEDVPAETQEDITEAEQE